VYRSHANYSSIGTGIFLRNPDGHPLGEPLVVSIDVSEIAFA
jgi:hypothetical protein